MLSFLESTEDTHVFLDDNFLQFSGLRQLILGEGFPAEEDVEHQLNSFNTEQIISAKVV